MRTISFITVAAMLAASSACTQKNEYAACGSFEAVEILVSAQGAGQLLEFNVAEGDRIGAGVSVGVIDTVQLHLQKRQLDAQMKSVLSSRPDIKSQVSSLRTQIARQKSEKARVEKLIAKGAAPAKQLDDINAQIEVLENQLSAQLSALSQNSSSLEHNAEALDAQIALVEDRIAKCRVSSPVSGTVIAKYANAGEFVNIGMPLMKVADLDTMYLRAYFTSDQLADITLGDKVKVTADYGDDKQFTYEGTITWISSESEFTPKAIQTRNTRANLVYAAKIAVRNDGRLKLGMYGTVEIPDQVGDDE